ncbi:hypothetical protein JZ751_005527 [Albula glossodonta]|uniref:Uncharacterized protein n=1 Tax=Albula glossodonta TaxID=121402 RepID=A0A8T2N430_9TELE|nr:hypothetical protein JZ751_005527 [Albula glossodonta]
MHNPGLIATVWEPGRGETDRALGRPRVVGVGRSGGGGGGGWGVNSTDPEATTWPSLVARDPNESGYYRWLARPEVSRLPLKITQATRYPRPRPATALASRPPCSPSPPTPKQNPLGRQKQRKKKKKCEKKSGGLFNLSLVFGALGGGWGGAAHARVRNVYGGFAVERLGQSISISCAEIKELLEEEEEEEAEESPEED